MCLCYYIWCLHRYMMQYLAWRVLAGLHKTVKISFLIVGHTKFSPDWCFGLIKQKLRRTNVNCLDDIVKVVESSAEANHAQLVGTQNGDILVPTYNWSSYFKQHFRKNAFAGIKSLHHFQFDEAHPGVVHVHTTSDQPEKVLDMLHDPSWRPTLGELPDVIPPMGLSYERQLYLFEKIREFCHPDLQDVVCPPPVQHQEVRSRPSTVSESQPPESSCAPVTKKPRLCSNCKQEGHNIRVCQASKSNL